MKPPFSGAIVTAGVEACGLEIGAAEAERLATFLNLLERWNRVHNLTGLHDPEQLITRHLVESLALKPWVIGPEAADLGSGGGLPGVPLAIAMPAIAFTLIESRRKRASFLRHVAGTLGLANVAVVHARAESVTCRPFATVLARAFAPPAELVGIARPLLAPGGRLVVLTSAGKAREIAAAATGFAELGPLAAAASAPSKILALELMALR